LLVTLATTPVLLALTTLLPKHARDCPELCVFGVI